MKRVRDQHSNVLVLSSGGIDSTCCLAYYRRDPNNLVKSIFIDYGQTAAKHESVSAAKVSEFYNVELQKIEVNSKSRFGDGLINGRNAFLVFTGLMFSPFVSGVISLGIHGGTHYADCSPLFLKKVQSLVDLYTDGRVTVEAPFITFSKKNIFDLLADFDVPLDSTYSCELGTKPPCGKCLSCRDRELYYGK